MSFFGVMCVVACTSVGEPSPFGVIPSRQQVEWHQMEYNMFVHFGPNTLSAGRTCWSRTVVNEDFTGPRLTRKALNEGTKDGNIWASAETDVSIRKGWFWKEKENATVKSLQHLLKIYYESVGRNSVLLLRKERDSNP